MSFKLCFSTMLAMILAAAAAGNRNLWKESDARAESSGWPAGIFAKNETLPGTFLPVQTRNPSGLAPGKLLVASRGLADPHFAKTVVLLVQYDPRGVVGLILNRRTQVPLSRVLNGVKGAKDRSDALYLGGPVDAPELFALFRSPAKVEGTENVFGDLYLISAKTVFEHIVSTQPDPGVFHVYLGYGGWTVEQLRAEVQLGAWFIFPADLGTVFNSDPDSLWREMIRKTEMQLAGSEPRQAVLSARTDAFFQLSYQR